MGVNVGLIFKMLDSVPEESLATFMLDQVSTLLGDLQSEMDVDLILKNWVEDNVTNKIVVSVGSPDSTSDTDDYSHDRPSYAYSDGKPTLLYGERQLNIGLTSLTFLTD
jgi:hypothetical protein